MAVGVLGPEVIENLDHLPPPSSRDCLPATLRRVQRDAADPSLGGPHTQLVVVTGWVRTVLGEDRLVSLLESTQWRLRQGPAIQNGANSMVFCCEDLRQESQWPDFSQAAEQIGVRSLLLCVLSVSDACRVTLTCCSPYASAFGHHQMLAASSLAVQAAEAVSRATIPHMPLLSEGLRVP